LNTLGRENSSPEYTRLRQSHRASRDRRDLGGPEEPAGLRRTGNDCVIQRRTHRKVACCLRSKDAGEDEQAEVAGRALDDEIAKSDFTIDELSEDAYFIKDDKKKSQ
jgi:hypothetical protein